MLAALPLLLLALTACDNEGDGIVKTTNGIESFTMDGFVVGDKLEQYFDGKKVRELYGRAKVDYASEIAFEKDETVMEFRAQSTGETVYTQTFNIHDETNEVPKFYFDGKDFYNTYPRPTPAEGEFLINFYFDFPASEGPVDVVAQVIEYYWNWDLPDPLVPIDTIPLPLFTNVQPGKWSEYMTLTPLPAMTPSRPDAEFWPFISVRKAGQTEGYYTSDKVEDNMLTFELRESWMTEGKVQSIYVGWLQPKPGEKVALYPQQNLVEMFP
jgi:hypothetical protein